MAACGAKADGSGACGLPGPRSWESHLKRHYPTQSGGSPLPHLGLPSKTCVIVTRTTARTLIIALMTPVGFIELTLKKGMCEDHLPYGMLLLGYVVNRQMRVVALRWGTQEHDG